MPPDIQEFRGRHPSLQNMVLLELGGEHGTDPMEKADAVYPNGNRISVRTTQDLRAILEGMDRPAEDTALRRLQVAAEREGDALLEGPVRYDTLMLLQRTLYNEQAKAAREQEESETPATITMTAQLKMRALLSKAASLFW